MVHEALDNTLVQARLTFPKNYAVCVNLVMRSIDVH
jgi:hypothetical protein